MVHGGNTMGGDLMIDSGEKAEENIIEHEESVLTDPIPRGVEMASFEYVENGLNAIDVRAARRHHIVRLYGHICTDAVTVPSMP